VKGGEREKCKEGREKRRKGYKREAKKWENNRCTGRSEKLERETK
jgi:hypothetical protein